jgi:uncharacterized membrane protein YkgB
MYVSESFDKNEYSKASMLFLKQSHNVKVHRGLYFPPFTYIGRLCLHELIMLTGDIIIKEQECGHVLQQVNSE